MTELSDIITAPRFAVEFLDLPAGEEPQRAGADTFTSALCTVATARGYGLDETLTEYDRPSARFFVYLPCLAEPTACVRDLQLVARQKTLKDYVWSR